MIMNPAWSTCAWCTLILQRSLQWSCNTAVLKLAWMQALSCIVLGKDRALKEIPWLNLVKLTGNLTITNLTSCVIYLRRLPSGANPLNLVQCIVQISLRSCKSFVCTTQWIHTAIRCHCSSCLVAVFGCLLMIISNNALVKVTLNKPLLRTRSRRLINTKLFLNSLCLLTPSIDSSSNPCTAWI